MEFARISAVAFVSVLAADVLDKGSLLVGLLSTRRSPAAVFFGAALAMLASCAIWVFAGTRIAPMLQSRWTHVVVGSALVAAGLFVMLVEEGES